jgi:hypothetical protein
MASMRASGLLHLGDMGSSNSSWSPTSKARCTEAMPGRTGFLLVTLISVIGSLLAFDQF